MLSPEETNFIQYWETNRDHQSGFMSKLLRGLPMASLFGVPILLSVAVIYFFFPEWYTKISAAVSGAVSVIFFAVLLAIIFYAFTRMHFKWEMNEQAYLELLAKSKRDAAKADQKDS